MRWLLAVCCLVGCNQIYGLDETKVREPPGLDRDMDGIDDPDDNCPDVANADQADIDHDDLGDACDGCTGCSACAVGPNHDEDGDKVPDGCDSCPTLNTSNVANLDNDDLGDACDPSPGTPQRRRFFDGFGTIDPSWAAIGDWRNTADGAETVAGPAPFGYRLTNASGFIDGTTQWRLEIVFEVPAAADDRDAIGAYVVDSTGAGQWACTVVWNIDRWEITNGFPEAITLAPGLAKLTMSSQRGGSSTHICKVNSNAEKTNATVVDESYPMGVQLYATRPTRFAYVEIIDGL